MARAVVALVLAAHTLWACAVTTSGLGTPDGAPPVDGASTADTGIGAIDGGPSSDDAGRDAAPIGVDAGPEERDGGTVAIDAGTDTGVIASCMASDETCNALDDDCDGTVDETGCTCRRETYGGHVYLFCTGSQPWTNAQADCRGWGYDLVTIGDDGENGFVRMNLSGDTWIGLNDRRSEGNYDWSDGSPFGYEHWRDPDAPRGAPAERDCAEMDPASGDWLDVDCAGTRPYVCEVDPDR